MDYLATWGKQKPLWNCENLRSGQGHFAVTRVGQIYSKKWGQGAGAWSPTFARFFSFCYAFERMNTFKMTPTERTGKKLFFMYHLLNLVNDCKCEDSNDGARDIFAFLNYTKMVATKYS